MSLNWRFYGKKSRRTHCNETYRNNHKPAACHTSFAPHRPGILLAILDEIERQELELHSLLVWQDGALITDAYWAPCTAPCSAYDAFRYQEFYVYGC
ncbi:hypothetical protein [Rhizobium nepotum]|uniref:hypothetical protein n=1 Tax=Rhizobium nepotum TaxID=1035271 RepID=UPI003CEADA87